MFAAWSVAANNAQQPGRRPFSGGSVVASILRQIMPWVNNLGDEQVLDLVDKHSYDSQCD